MKFLSAIILTCLMISSAFAQTHDENTICREAAEKAAVKKTLRLPNYGLDYCQVSFGFKHVSISGNQSLFEGDVGCSQNLGTKAKVITESGRNWLGDFTCRAIQVDLFPGR